MNNYIHKLTIGIIFCSVLLFSSIMNISINDSSICEQESTDINNKEIESVCSLNCIPISESEINVSEICDLSYHSTNTNDHYGTVISSAGDIDGDGYEDTLIGTTYVGESEREVYLIYGDQYSIEGDFNLSHTDAVFTKGISGSVYFGSSFSGVGDVNNDGYDDMIIGDYWYGGSKGQVYLFFGKHDRWSGNCTSADADVVFHSEGKDGLGSDSEGVGDVNGDGIDDFIIGAYVWDEYGGGVQYKGKAYVFFGKENGWSSDIDVTDANASIIGVDWGDYLGRYISAIGDVNSDGYNDFAFGIPSKNLNKGEVSIVFGKPLNWDHNVPITSIGIIFSGVSEQDRTGYSISGGEDLNGDGFDDILVGGYRQYSPVFIILGKENGWTNNSLDNVDASIIGEGDYFGFSICFLGDINHDGYSDFIIGAPGIPSGSCSTPGKAYIVSGKENSWTQDMNIGPLATKTICGEWNNDHFGYEIAKIGSFNGGLTNDFIISSPFYCNNSRMGKVYVLSESSNEEPEEVISIEVFSDIGFINHLKYGDKGERVYIELVGEDGNNSKQNFATINIVSDVTGDNKAVLKLKETGMNTGIYRGSYRIPISSPYGDKRIITHIIDTSDTCSFIIDTPVRLGEYDDIINYFEDNEIHIIFKNHGYGEYVQWKMESNANWLLFNELTGVLNGTPTNRDIGEFYAIINLTDNNGHFDEHEFTIRTHNTAPRILTDNKNTITQDEFYLVDYKSDDDGLGDISWSLATNGSWLEIEEQSGILRGIPTNNDVGWIWVRVWVNDGNGGRTETRFNLTVVNKNDAPYIIIPDENIYDPSVPKKKNYEVNQDEYFKIQYEVRDIDNGDNHRWELWTNADWLTLNKATGKLYGIPNSTEVGTFSVHVSVNDSGGLKDTHSFNLMVIDINDPPLFIDVPDDISITRGSLFRFDVNGSDVDEATILRYSISSEPRTNISIDSETGIITWYSSIEGLHSPPYEINVKISAMDGEYKIDHTFKITVSLSTKPNSKIIYPKDGSRVSSKKIILEWSGFDLENESLSYSVYIGTTQAHVLSLKEELCIIEDHRSTNLDASGLDPGKLYYWIVIPFDGGSYGSCLNGVNSFYVNSLPNLDPIEFIEIKAGKGFSYRVIGNDKDIDDRIDLNFSLVEAPKGMSISEESGMIRWTPKNDQVMMHSVIVRLSDGFEYTEISFNIEVLPNDDTDYNQIIATFGGIGLLVIIVVFVIVGLIIKNNKRSPKECHNGEQVIGSFGEEEEIPQVDCAVPLTPAEAHAKLGKGSKPVSYEDLYGISAPEKEGDGMTTRELKDFISDKIAELESIPDQLEE